MEVLSLLIGLGGLAFGVYQYRARTRIKLKLDLSRGVYQDAATPPRPAIFIEFVNHGEKDAHVTKAGVFEQGSPDTRLDLGKYAPSSQLPLDVASGYPDFVWLDMIGLVEAGVEIADPIVGWVETATGQVFRSKPWTLKGASERDELPPGRKPDPRKPPPQAYFM